MGPSRQISDAQVEALTIRTMARYSQSAVSRLRWSAYRSSHAAGTFGSVRDLEAAIGDYRAHHNDTAKPFTWTADADSILEDDHSLLPATA